MSLDSPVIAYAGESRLTGVGYTGKSGLSDVIYTGETDHQCGLHRGVHKSLVLTKTLGESLVQPSRPANALKGTTPQKSDSEC